MLARRRSATALAAVAAISILWLAVPKAADGPSAADLFDDSVLHELRLSMYAGDWDLLRARCMENTYYPVDVEWRGQVVRNAGVRSRGSGSRDSRKPSLKLDFDRYVEDQTWLGLKALDLDNYRQDAGMMKELLSMQFFRRMGVAAPRAVQARLYVNGAYAGLYAALEPIDKKFLKAALGENDGHLYEFEWSDGYRLEWLGPDLQRYAAIFKPQTREEEPPQFLYEPIAAMIAAVNHTSRDAWEQTLTRFFDLDLLLSYLAVEMFLSDHDGLAGDWGLNNFYLYRYEDSDRFQLVPWDKDVNFRELERDVYAGFEGHALIGPALAQPRLREAYVAALRRAAAVSIEPAADGSGPGWLEREVARQAALIRTAACEDEQKAYSNPRFDQEVDWMLEFARHRAAQVLRQVGPAQR